MAEVKSASPIAHKAKTSKTPAAKKPIAKKPAVKKAIAKNPAVKKPVAKKAPTKKPAIKKTVAKKAGASKGRPAQYAKKSSAIAQADNRDDARESLKAKVSSFAELVKKQSELETIRKQAKAELRRIFEAKLKEAEAIKAQYKSLFAESLDFEPKGRKPRRAGAKAKRANLRVAAPISLPEVLSFIEQKQKGKDVKAIKIKGRKPKSVLRIGEAYAKAQVKDAKTVLGLLK
jgi:histone H1/5